MTLRSYQTRALDDVRTQYAKGVRRVLLLLPTGAGKSFCASHIARGVVDNGGRVLFVAPLREIVQDTASAFRSQGLYTGVIMADEKVEPIARAQVASVQTLVARYKKSGPDALPPATFVVIDEAHHGVADTWAEVAAQYPRAHILLLTATPEGSAGRTLGPVADVIVEGPSMHELVSLGALVPYTLLAPDRPLDGAVAIDPVDAVVQGQTGPLRGSWGPRRAMVFCVSREHALMVAEQLRVRGVSAECILGDTGRETRNGVRGRVASGATRALVVCGVGLEGFDLPACDHVVLAAPFSTIGRFRQAIGRGMRPCSATGKADLLVHDLRGAVYLHGLPDESVRWSLEGGDACTRTERLPAIARCAACGAVYRPTVACPRCGFEGERRVLIPRVASRAEKLEEFNKLPEWERDERYLAKLVRSAPRTFTRARAEHWALEKFRARWSREPVQRPVTQGALSFGGRHG